jgi:translation initiation factor IF-1
MDAIAVEGVVTEPLPNALYSVELQDGRRILAHVGPPLRIPFTKILPGDRVRVELAPYDPSRGRITHRFTERRMRPSAPGES